VALADVRRVRWDGILVTFVDNDGGPKPQVRRDIQALRAIAVILVVFFHLFPEVVPAGFVGVDAFFVISGFLITSHLLREADATGRVQVLRFWAARARRLLPAAFLVLLTCLVLTVTLVPLSYHERFLRETNAAVFYALNWKLARDSVDYWAPEDSVSPVQHFWSLSVEEQFYVVWPLLFALGLLMWPAKGRRRSADGVVGAILLVLVVSLTISVSSGLKHDAADYFRTWNRAWEFATGGIIALFAPPIRSLRVASGLAWLGLATTIGSAWLLPADAAFPGAWALLPVVGTALTLWFGASAGPGASALLSGRAVQWIGNTSYAIYLWHWPLIVFYRAIFGRPVDVASACALLLATGVLAALTKWGVEDPVRFSPVLVRRSGWLTLASVVVTMAGLALFFQVALEEQAKVTKARHPLLGRLRSDGIPCFGATATPGCNNPEVAGQVLPNPSAAHVDRGRFCMADNQAETEVRLCPRGAKKKVRTTTAVIGDSHAGHLVPMLAFGARERRERIVQLLKGSCPFTAHERAGDDILRESCEVFKDKVDRELAVRKEITRVVTSASSRNPLVVEAGMEPFESAVLGYMTALDGLPEHVREVIVVRDVPRLDPDVIHCLERLGSAAAQLEPRACALEREQALIDDPLAEAARRLRGRVRLLDFTDVFCDDQACSPVVQNALVYRDSHHLTETFALTLAPRFQAELRRIAKQLKVLEVAGP